MKNSQDSAHLHVIVVDLFELHIFSSLIQDRLQSCYTPGRGGGGGREGRGGGGGIESSSPTVECSQKFLLCINRWGTSAEHKIICSWMSGNDSNMLGYGCNDFHHQHLSSLMIAKEAEKNMILLLFGCGFLWVFPCWAVQIPLLPWLHKYPQLSSSH